MQTLPLFELLGWSALIKLYSKILRLFLSEEMFESRHVSLIQIKSYLNNELYASRDITLAQLWARRLFTFQWQQERENSSFSFGPGLDSTSLLHSKVRFWQKLQWCRVEQ